MKKIVSLLLVLSVCLSMVTITAFANEPVSKSLKVNTVDTLNEATFDLTNHTRQSKTVMVNGQECTMVLEPVNQPITRGVYDLTDGEWRIYWYGVGLNAEYFIEIDDSKIVDAYEPSCTTFGFTLKSSDLSFTSKKASYHLEADMKISDFGFSYSGGLYAKIINGDQLNTYLK